MVIMELTKEVENVAFDGRKRSGYQSQRLFPKGTRFALMGTAGGLSARFTTGDETFEDQRLIVALLANAKPSEASSYAEIAISLPEYVDAERVLDQLLLAGVVDERAIRTAAMAAGDQ